MPRNRRTKLERKPIRLLVEEVVEAEGEDGEVVWVAVEEAAEEAAEEVEAGEGVVEGDSRPFNNIFCVKA